MLAQIPEKSLVCASFDPHGVNNNVHIFVDIQFCLFVFALSKCHMVQLANGAASTRPHARCPTKNLTFLSHTDI